MHRLTVEQAILIDFILSADRFSISLKDIIDIFDLTSMKSPLLLAKGKGDYRLSE